MGQAMSIQFTSWPAVGRSAEVYGKVPRRDAGRARAEIHALVADAMAGDARRFHALENGAPFREVALQFHEFGDRRERLAAERIG